MSLRAPTHKPAAEGGPVAARQARILDLLAQRGAMGIMELRGHLNCSRMTLHNALQCLLEAGEVQAIKWKNALKYAMATPETTAPADEDDDLGSRPVERPINGDPSHRAVKFPKDWRAGTGLRAARRGQGWTPLASPYLLD